MSSPVVKLGICHLLKSCLIIKRDLADRNRGWLLQLEKIMALSDLDILAPSLILDPAWLT